MTGPLPARAAPRAASGSGGAAPGLPASSGPGPWKAAFFLLAGVGAVALLAWVLLGSRLLVVRAVEVTGTHVVPKSEVLAAAAIPEGLPLLRVDTGAAARRVERIAQVRSVVVSRDWPDRIVIEVQERTPALAVPAVGGGFLLVDPSGVIVQVVTRRPVALPLFIPAGPLPGNPDVRAAASVVRGLPPSLARRVTSVTVPGPDAVTLHLSDRVTVVWGSPGLTAQKARVLAILMRTHARYYDVSAPGTAVTG